MTQTVTEMYLEGIKDGRTMLRNMIARGDAPTLPDMEDLAQGASDTARTFSAGPVKDYLRGERDFWRNQVRKGVAA